MLYDPKWEKKIEVDPLGLSALIAWLEQQPAEKHYDKHDPDRCLYAQFYGTVGAEPPLTLHGVHARIAFPRPQTFGAALARARAIIAND